MGESSRSWKLAAALLAVAVLAATNVEASDEREPARPVPLHEHPTLVEMLRVNNHLRLSVGRAPHRLCPRLTQAAQHHARYMAATGDFRHEANLGPLGRAQRFGFRGLIRENIASGQRSVPGVFRSWQSSSGHWASIVSDTNLAGFGYAISPRGTTYWVAVYGD